MSDAAEFSVAALAVGDEVGIVFQRWGARRARVTTVTRLTATLVCTAAGERFTQATGRRIGEPYESLVSVADARTVMAAERMEQIMDDLSYRICSAGRSLKPEAASRLRQLADEIDALFAEGAP